MGDTTPPSGPEVGPAPTNHGGRSGSSERRPSVSRPVRVAVASVDGKFVHEHFGRARSFQIFDLADDTLFFVETRTTDPACKAEGHDDTQLQRTIEVVSDADIVLVAAIGPVAEAALGALGIRAFVIQDFIPDALRALQKALPRLNLSSKPRKRTRNGS